MADDITKLLSYDLGSSPSGDLKFVSDLKFVPEPKTTAQESLGQGYLQGATLGVANPLLAGIAALQNPSGGPRSEEFQNALNYFKTKTREAKEAHPGLYTTGDVASYLGPSLPGSLYKSVGKEAMGTLGRAGVKAMVPGLETAVKTGAGLAVTEGLKKFGETESPKEASLQAVKSGAQGFVMGPPVEWAVGAGAKLLEKMASPVGTRLTGTNYNALKEWAIGKSKGGAKMSDLTRKAVQEFPDVAQDLADMAKSGTPIPEYAEAMKALKNLPASTNVPIDKTVARLIRGVHEGEVAPSKEADVAKLRKWFVRSGKKPGYIMKNLKPGQKELWAEDQISGVDAERLKRALQGEVNYGSLPRDNPYYSKVMKEAAGTLREDLRNVPGAEEYGTKMDVAAQKLKALEGLQNYLGKKAGKLEINAERLLKNAPTKEASNIINALDEAFGTQYGETAQGISLARQLGGQSKAMSATPQFLTTYRTGAAPGWAGLSGAGIGSLIKAAGGGVPLSTGLGVLGGAAATSPTVWAEGIRGLNALYPGLQPAITAGTQELPKLSQEMYDAILRRMEKE